MALSNDKIREYIKRLLLSRMRILCNNGFYGLLLMHMVYSIDEDCQTAATDGYRIYFGPEFLENLSDSELDFVMMHEILHVVFQHCLRCVDINHDVYNIACDIVVNSNILKSEDMNIKSITLRKWGASIHLAPDGKEGFNYTAEQVCSMLTQGKNSGKEKPLNGIAPGKAKHSQYSGGQSKAVFDDHSLWGMSEDDDALRDVWVKRFEDACEAVSLQDSSNSRGLLPAFAERMFDELHKTQTDWRTVLNDFIQEEIVDYSFTPPDRRYTDTPFFLPDFNGTEDKVENILFMIDTSASMTDAMITAAYSEIKGAIDQFDGKLKGWLGFFDAAIIEPKPFEDEASLRVIRPEGGGGTDFQIIFEYVHKHMQNCLPASIVILTDGFAPFPQEHLSMNIPVLWLLNNENVSPPWGKVARIKL